nr:zinc finger BED domain-containing protein RICESLEEPER 2 [Tanacetum cinerariifolium]
MADLKPTEIEKQNRPDTNRTEPKDSRSGLGFIFWVFWSRGQTINLNSAVYGHESNKDENNKKKNDNKKNGKKHKRKPGGRIGNETAKCWKYFDLKMEQPDGPDRSWIKMAHFVKAGLKVQKKEVETIGLGVKYIKNSSQRIKKFKASTKKTCDSNRFLIAECRMRWNSTYDMLKSAIDLQEAFYNYSMNNASFFRDLKAIPHRTDFDVCQKFCDFLEKLKDKTELVSTQSGPIAHLFFSEILDVEKHLRYTFRSNHEIRNAWLRVRHLMENDCIPEENEDEENTPIAFLTDSEKVYKIKNLVYEVETKMEVFFALYNEKYGTKLTHNSSDVKKHPPLKVATQLIDMVILS